MVGTLRESGWSPSPQATLCFEIHYRLTEGLTDGARRRGGALDEAVPIRHEPVPISGIPDGLVAADPYADSVAEADSVGKKAMRRPNTRHATWRSGETRMARGRQCARQAELGRRWDPGAGWLYSTARDH